MIRRRWEVVGIVALAVGALAPVAHAGPLGAALPPCATTDWPMFGHDVARTFSSPDQCISRTTAASLTPRWFFDTSAPVTAQPAVAGGSVFAGDYNGIFYALDATSGALKWKIDTKQYDTDSTDFGRIPGSAAVTDTGSGTRVVIVGAGATLFVFNANTGQIVDRMCLDRVDPTCHNGSGATTEIESSPVVVHNGHAGNGRAQILVGTDVNESDPAGAAGLVSLLLDSAGHLHPDWWFDAETSTGQAYQGLAPLSPDGSPHEHGCSDVWSSPAVDLSTSTVSFGVGNCNHPEQIGRDPNLAPKLVESTIALDLTSGALEWQRAPHAPGNGLDLDFGATPNVLEPGVVGEGGKDGRYYAYDSATGAPLWNVQVATGSSIGGIIPSTSVGQFSSGLCAGHSAVFADTAIPISPSDPKGSLANSVTHPTQAQAVHAIDATTHKVCWDALSLPSYGAPVFDNGVLFVPDTFSDQLLVLDGDTGVTLRTIPLNVPPASPVAVSGNRVFLGAGVGENGLPVNNYGGIWAFSTLP